MVEAWAASMWPARGQPALLTASEAPPGRPENVVSFVGRGPLWRGRDMALKSTPPRRQSHRDGPFPRQVLKFLRVGKERLQLLELAAGGGEGVYAAFAHEGTQLTVAGTAPPPAGTPPRTGASRRRRSARTPRPRVARLSAETAEARVEAGVACQERDTRCAERRAVEAEPGALD